MKSAVGGMLAPAKLVGSVRGEQSALCAVQDDPPRADAAVAVRPDRSDIAARTVVVSLFTVMAVRLGLDYAQTGRLTGLLLLASEALVVVLTMLRRAPATVDRSTQARILTALSMAGPPLVQPGTVAPLFADALTAAVSACGLLVVIAGKLSLGRSFGLMPANRGIVSSGLYRFVRHPIYLGYLITHTAFVAANPTGWNLLMLAGADLALLARAVREERTLAQEDEYRNYQGRVRWRVVPGLF
jgi:protein-S-isoprenylcysteine O-methyltransferase Ste14